MDINLALHFPVISASCSRTAGDAAPLVPAQGASGQLLVHEGSGGGRRPHLSVAPEGIPGVFSLSLTHRYPCQWPHSRARKILVVDYCLFSARFTMSEEIASGDTE